MRKKMWRCKSCGRVCDSSNTVCPDCGLDLGFYGEIQFVETGDPEPSSASGSQPQKQAEPAVKEESKPEIKEEHNAKEPKPKKKGKRGKVLIAAGVVLLALLALGSFMFMNLRRVKAIELESLDLVYKLESGSEEYLLMRVDYTGFWGPWPELTVTSSDSSVVKVLSVEKNPEELEDADWNAKIWMECGNPGTAEITATAGDKSDSRQVPVYQITGVELTVPEELMTGDGIVLDLEDSVSYTARLQYAGEVHSEKILPKVEVSSSDTDIVEVDPESGKLIAKDYGTAVITASVGDYEKSIPVYVFGVTDVELLCYDLLVDGDGKTMYWIPEGLTMWCDIYYHYMGPDLDGIPYMLESSNENVLSVDPVNFTITAVGPGEATITAAMGSFSDSMTLEVYPVDRSNGSWVEGSIQTIAAPAEDSSSKASYKITVCFGDGTDYLTVPMYFGAGGSISYTTGWEKVEENDRVQAREGTITLQGRKWEQERSIAGITFLFKKASSEAGDYNPATDLLDYWVIYTE